MGATEVDEKIRRTLTEWGVHVELTAEGYRLPYESTFVHISVIEQESRVLVDFTAPVLYGLEPSAELYEWVATSGQAYFFGRSHLLKNDDGTLTLIFEHTLLGDYLDPEELRSVIRALANTADQLDDELKPRFGGTRVVD